MKPMARSPRKRRLCKKLRIAEFQEFGFQVDFKLSDELTIAQSNGFWDALIAHIEANKLLFAGNESAFVYRDGIGSASESDRETLRSWLSFRPEASSIVIGPLVDANYPECTEPPIALLP
ncbi:YggL family protein [Arenimonas sp.]|uniref:YggL 50S ribosome-binding family protein n=1 Tax=Arenimonas sp. TaxID=1872635 RepID=UPI0039E627C4